MSSEQNHGLRVPFTVIQKEFEVANETMEDILGVFCWSMRHLMAGKRPIKRHDQSEWFSDYKVKPAQGDPAGLQYSDKERMKQGMNKRELPCKAVLAEIRGDWDWFVSLLKFPGYNRTSGTCWMCNATYKKFKEASKRQPAQGCGHVFMQA